MDIAELKVILHKNGGFSISRKKSGGKLYIHATKKIPHTRRQREIYLGPEAKLGEKTEVDILRRLLEYAHRQETLPGKLE